MRTYYHSLAIGIGRWGDGEMGRWGDGEVWAILLALCILNSEFGLGKR